MRQLDCIKWVGQLCFLSHQISTSIGVAVSQVAMTLEDCYCYTQHNLELNFIWGLVLSFSMLNPNFDPVDICPDSFKAEYSFGSNIFGLKIFICHQIFQTSYRAKPKLGQLFSTHPPNPQEKYRGGYFKFVEPSLTVNKWPSTIWPYNICPRNIWLCTIATTPVCTKQSNFKLANTELGTAQPQLVLVLVVTWNNTVNS